jgi:hypothetical protein
VRIVREPSIAGTVVVVDGVPGCGKTLFSAIVSSLARVELEKYDYALEQSCQLRKLGKLEEDAAQTMVRLCTDLDLYNLMMARETNFRWSDLSGVWSNPRPWRYLKRAFGPGDGAVTPRIAAERPILHLVTHNLLAVGAPLFPALGERLRVVEVVRHPLYSLKQWRLYIERYGLDERDFTVWFGGPGGKALPWFAHGWEARYLAANPMDRVILCLERLLGLARETLESRPLHERDRVLTIPFEPFVKEPEPWMGKLCAFLGTERIPETERELRRQKVPRAMIADGIDLAIYRENGWKPPVAGDESGELALRRKYAVDEGATPEGLAVLDRLCREYEETWLADSAARSLVGTVR